MALAMTRNPEQKLFQAPTAKPKSFVFRCALATLEPALKATAVRRPLFWRVRVSKNRGLGSLYKRSCSVLWFIPEILAKP